MRILATFLFILFLQTVSFAQTIVSGYVRNSEGISEEGILVTAFSPSDTTIVGYSFADSDGLYSISVSEKIDSLLLQIHGFNVRKQRIRVANRTQKLDWTAVEESITLKEVQVKAERLWGSKDSLNYLVSAYTRNHDVTIGDILKQLPGISVDDNGTIKYQGVPISKFYIENMDVLQGRYNIATNSVKAEDVATVQVLENHQHVKALQDQTPPASAALNLKLKRDKGVWSGDGRFCAGYDDRFLFSTSITDMLLGKKRQHVFYYGADNVGSGSYMLEEHYDMTGVHPQVLTTVVYPEESPVGRCIRNNYHELSTHNLMKLAEDKDLHLDLIFHHDRRRAEGSNRISYLMPDGSTLVMEEAVSSRITDNNLQMNLVYEYNATHRYVNNAINIVGKWNDSRSDVFGNGKIIQDSYYRTIGIRDKFSFISRTENGRGYELKSDNIFSVSPQALTVIPENVRQNVDVRHLVTSNDFSLLRNIRKRRFTIVPAAHVNLSYVGANSMLKGKSLLNHFEGEMGFLQIDAGIGPKMIYSNWNLNVTANLPMSLNGTYLASSSEDDKKRLTLLLSPSVDMTWKIADSWTVIGNGRYGLTQNSWREMYSVYVLSNYRSISRYEGGIFDNEIITGSLRTSYKNLLGQYFSWVEISPTRIRSAITYGIAIDENGYTVMQMEAAPHTADSWTIRVNVRKDWDWKSLSADLNFSYRDTRSQYLRQSVLTYYKSETCGMKGRASLSPSNWLNIFYDSDWSLYRSYMAETNAEDLKLWINNLRLNINLFGNKFFAGLTGTHQYNSMLSVKHHYFADADLRIRLKNKSEITLRGSNLLNTHRYYNVINSNMMEQYSEISLLPRAIVAGFTVIF